MTLNKSKGRMFKSVGWTWNPIYGCTHSCPYKCWARFIVEKRWKKIWEPTFREHYLTDSFPNDGTWIFVGSMGDLFCDGFTNEEIFKVLEVIENYAGDNKFLLQTKNPLRLLYWEIQNRLRRMQDKIVVGTTLETNRLISGMAPPTKERYECLHWLKKQGYTTFLSLEPLADFDNEEFSSWLLNLYPDSMELGLENYTNVFKKPSDDKLKGLLGFLRANNFNFVLKEGLKSSLPSANQSSIRGKTDAF